MYGLLRRVSEAVGPVGPWPYHFLCLLFNILEAISAKHWHICILSGNLSQPSLANLRNYPSLRAGDPLQLIAIATLALGFHPLGLRD